MVEKSTKDDVTSKSKLGSASPAVKDLQTQINQKMLSDFQNKFGQYFK